MVGAMGRSNAQATAELAGRCGVEMRSLRQLYFLALVSLGIYLAISVLSRRFVYHYPLRDRPILMVVGLLAAAFFAYVAAILVCRRWDDDRQAMRVVLGSAVLFRLVMVPSYPIQEVDIYRYLWDGQVTLAKVSPFRFTPRQVQLADDAPALDPSLRRLVKRKREDRVTAEVLRRVHYAELPTVYRSVSQIVFACQFRRRSRPSFR